METRIDLRLLLVKRPFADLLLLRESNNQRISDVFGQVTFDFTLMNLSCLVIIIWTPQAAASIRLFREQLVLMARTCSESSLPVVSAAAKERLVPVVIMMLARNY